jgi:hypothetical protein
MKSQEVQVFNFDHKVVKKRDPHDLGPEDP